MRLQHVSVMFIVIFIPIILVTSYFISLQVNTVKLESSYTEKLLDATYDAMTAFELNTANENLSSVSDSLRSIIEASTNIFFNTLCTNFGISNASKSYIQPYIPVMLYTLYDGYYIYAPTNVPEICVDKFGNTMRVGDYGVQGSPGNYTFDQASVTYTETTPSAGPQITTVNEDYGQILYRNKGMPITYSTKINNNTYYKRDYILKSYIPYTARYENGSTNIVVNYTLDNFMNIEGYIGGTYYTKSGYFTAQNLIKEIKINGVSMAEPGKTFATDSTAWQRYSEEELKRFIWDPENYNVEITIEGNSSSDIVFSNRDGFTNIPLPTGGSAPEYWDDVQSAIEYYVDSYIFSSWVRANLSTIVASNFKNTDYKVADMNGVQPTQDIDSKTKTSDKMLYDFASDSTRPFGTASDDPESEESVFYNHKRNVIKNSITYNLILSMVVYTEESRTVEFNMPAFKETEWDRILNNVSVTAFMEGMRCGLKYYNDYAIVTSSNNEISISDNEIYYVPRFKNAAGTDKNIIDDKTDDSDLDKSYKIAHRIDCEELKLDKFGAISFTSKEIKYDKILNKDGTYSYDHRVFTDYDCIVDSNYSLKTSDSGGIPIYSGPNGESYRLNGNTNILYYLKRFSNSSGDALQQNLWWKLRAYRIAVAKERNNLYKTTALPENYGWSYAYAVDGSDLTSTSVKKKDYSNSDIFELDLNPTRSQLKEIKKIEITIEDLKILDNSDNPVYGVYTDSITASFNTNNGEKVYPDAQTVSVTSTSRRTLEYTFDFDCKDTVTINSSKGLRLKVGDPRTRFAIEAVKIYYK